ncbi:MAG TPA: S8 family serine peptidase, partial [Ignavibacteriaceae bacterium]|nr:S8 family serine peptidase [Ignavibacteriaceae bacterium]
MMKQVVFTFLILAGFVFAQTPVDKVTSNLKLKLAETEQNSEVLVWVYFKDKGMNQDSYFNNPLSVVSEKSLKRRAKVLEENKLITFEDLPLSTSYLNEIKNSGLKIRHSSKWLNAVSGYINKNLVQNLSRFSFVDKIDMVFSFKKSNEPVEENSQITKQPTQPLNKPLSFNYGESFTQLQQINVPAVHDLGFTGQGVTICVMDAGFNRLTHQAFNNMDIIAAWDFVNGDANVGDEGDMGEGSHGTQTLSTIGGFFEGQLIGPAFNASFILAKTENTESETTLEEDNWIAALEWADSIGVDVTSTSLGYLDQYTPPYTGYTWEDMDGNTTIITIGADLAVARGIVVVNSAGNEGNDPSHNTLGAPADGDSVIAVGSVNSSGNRSSFSSVGPTVDGRTKPDIMAMGSNVYVASPWSNTQYTNSNGTSFSCPLAGGVAALILCVNPNLTPMQVRDAMRLTASNHLSPNNQMGWGVLDALDAINYFPLPVELISFTGISEGNKVKLEWSTATESNNFGFEIERKSEKGNFITAGFINGNGTTTNRSDYLFIDKNLTTGNYVYRLKQIDFDGSFDYSNGINVSVAVPQDFVLYQNYPNPFNPSTTIKYSVPKTSYLKLELYDVLGNKIKTIDEGIKTVGIHQLEFSAENLS